MGQSWLDNNKVSASSQITGVTEEWRSQESLVFFKGHENHQEQDVSTKKNLVQSQKWARLGSTQP